MHAYFPALNSYPSLLGDQLANGINCLGFTWVCNRVMMEVMCDRLNVSKYLARFYTFLYKNCRHPVQHAQS